jgi:hypothetical protein
MGQKVRRHGKFLFLCASVIVLAISIYLFRAPDSRAPSSSSKSQVRAAPALSTNRHPTGPEEHIGRIERPPPKFRTPEKAVGRYQPVAMREFWTQKNSKDIKLPWYYYEREKREEPWATEIEKQVRAKLAPEHVKALGLESVSLDEIDCRASSCRAIVSWSKEDAVAVSSINDANAPDPLYYLHLKDGRLAHGTWRVPAKPGELLDPHTKGGTVRVKLRDGRFFVEQVLLFNEDDIHPDDYRIARRADPAAASTVRLPTR